MVFNKKDANKKHYFSTVPAEELASTMKTAVSEKMPVKIWEEKKSKQNVEDYSTAQWESITKILTLKNEGGLLSKLTKSKLIGKTVFIKIGSDKFQFFTTSTMQYDETIKCHTVSLAGDIYKTQQRTNYRLKANKFNTIQIKVGDDVFDGLDISAGGTSIIVEESTAKRYPQGSEFEYPTLRFNRKNFSIPTIKIAGQWEEKDSEHKATGNVKIGIQFCNMTTAIEEELFKHINTEARAEEIRKKLKK